MSSSINSARVNRRTLLGLGGLSATALLLAACGGNGDTALDGGSNNNGSSDKIVVGSADFTESQIIAEIYAAALNKKGITAETKPAIGAREAYIGALKEGSVGVVPDYTGNLLLYLDSSATAVTPEEIVTALKEKTPSELAVLEPAKAENKDSMVVTQETSQQYNLKSLSDLAAQTKKLKLGAPPEFAERAYGLPGLKAKYGFEPAEFSPINDGGGPLTVKALTDGTVQIVDLFSTDPAIKANNFVVLEDPKNNFIAQQVVPVVNAKAVSTAATQVLNEVSAKLTTEHLIELNTRVSGDEKASPATAAQEWVKKNF